MAERAQSDPTMEEIVVALRQTTRDADRVLPFAGAGQPRGKRPVRAFSIPSGVADLRDDEIERLLEENTRLNARVISLLKVLEHEQAVHAENLVELSAETAGMEADRESIMREVRTALEAELSPILLVVLRLLEKQRGNPGTDTREAARGVGPGPAAYQTPSGWMIDLMQRMDDDGPVPSGKAAAADLEPRRSKFRELSAQVLNALRPEPYAVPPRRRQSPHKGPT